MQAQEGGFTLLELLVVIALMGLMLSLVLSVAPPRRPILVLRTAGAEIAGALDRARAEAIASDQQRGVAIRLDPPAWRLGKGRFHRLPQQLALHLRTATGDAPGSDIGHFLFAPDGSASGGAIRLALAGQHLTIAVDWLTGRVRTLHGS